jgi:hypothetical protein
MRLHRKSFDLKTKTAESQYEIIDKEMVQGENFDPLVIENARLYQLAQERADKLEKAQQEIKILRGIIPICTSCKKVRDDEGYWQQVETYISDHSEALFSHGVCPDCMEELYPEYTQRIKEHKKQAKLLEKKP